VLESGYRRLQEPPSLTLPLIRAYRTIGRHGDAGRVAARCAGRWPAMREACEAAAAPAAPVPSR
jgi:hypothetical protein